MDDPSSLPIDDFVESREGKVTQEQRALIGHLYTLCKDQVADMASFRPFLARLLPLYEGTAFGRKSNIPSPPMDLH